MLRGGRPRDGDQIVALNEAGNGKESGPDVRILLADPEVGPERFTVVVDGERVVSTMVLLAHEWELGGVTIPVGQPEFVVTDPDYKGRGLIRAQMDDVLGKRESAADAFRAKACSVSTSSATHGRGSFV